VPTPKAGYFLDNKRIPSVTTITGRYKYADPLIFWAWSLGMEGKDYRDVKQEAANAGICCHSMVEAFIRGKPFDPSPYPVETLTKAENGYSAFRRWADQSRLKPEKTELSLVSRRWKFGGTLDSIQIDGQIRLFDWKCANGVWPEYLLQLAAYGALYDENFPKTPVEGYDLVRFDKSEHADFAHYSFTSLKDELAQFLLLRKAYEFDQKLKKRLR
jgi:hypothetical protein